MKFYIAPLTAAVFCFSSQVLAEAKVPPVTAQCEVQLARADVRIEHKPDTGAEARVIFKAQNSLRSTGKLVLNFPNSNPEGAYTVELSLVLENGRSTWLEDAPRLTVTTRVLQTSSKTLIAIGEAQSDQLWSPEMLYSRQYGNGPRVISKLSNPQIRDVLEKITDPEILELRSRDEDAGLFEAVRRKLVNGDHFDRVDTVCVMK